MAKDEIVRAQFKIKILGTWIQNDMRMDADINKLSSILHNRINNIRKINKYTDFHSRLKFINGYVMGKMNYMLPIYNNIPKYLYNKLHKILMKSARCAIGNYCFRKSTSYILSKCKWMTIDQMITYSSLVFIHSVNKHKKPKGVLNIYRNSRYNRHKANISVSYTPKNQKYAKLFIQEHTNTYNKVPAEIKEKSNKIFKNELKLWIKSQPVDTKD